MKKSNRIITFASLASVALLTGCIEETLPESSTATAEQINASPAALEASLAGVPSAMSKGYYVYGKQEHETDMAYPAYCIAQTELLGDMYPLGSNSGYDWYRSYNVGCATGSFGSNTYFAYLPWFTFYKFIKVCNDVISVVDVETEESPSKLCIVGQAYAARAFDYYMLSVLYEPVASKYVDCSAVLGSNPPHTALTVCKVTETTTAEEAKNNPRMTHDEAVALMLSDLDKAEYCFAAEDGPGHNLPNLATVYGLKAKVHLWDENYAKAAEYARMAIEAFGGAPMTKAQWLDKSSAFSVANDAWMWYVTYSAEEMGNLCNFIGWISGEADWGYASLTCPGIDKSLYDQIGVNDFRRASFLDPDREETLKWYNGKYENMTVRDKSFIEDAPDYLSIKFRCKDGDWENYAVGGASDVPIMRVEEMYLIEALAKGKQNVGDGIVALNNFVKTYRDPAYNCTAATEREFELAALTQMRIEFWGEGNAFPVAKRVQPGVMQNYEGTNAPSDIFKFNCEGGKPNWTLVIPTYETQSNQVLQDQNNPDPSQSVPYPSPVGEYSQPK